MPDEEILERLPAAIDFIRLLAPDQLLAHLSPESRAALAEQLREEGSNAKPNATEPERGKGT
jgi:hypothetical protein